MNTDDYASKIEELQKEVATLRQQNEEYRRLASFPQSNPNPVLEFNQDGKLLYLNPAASQILSQHGLDDAHIFLPNDYAEMSRTARENKVTQSLREMRIESQIIEENIYYSHEFDSIRIYAVDITQRLQTEEALNQSQQELLRFPSVCRLPSKPF